MIGDGQRPVRRTEVFACAIVLVVVCGGAGGFFGFLGMTVHPAFLGLAGLMVAGGAGIGWWMWRDLRLTDKTMEHIEETVLIDVEAIARYKPPTTRRRRDPRRWLRYFGHNNRSAKEVAQR